MSAPKRHRLVKTDIVESARWYDERKPGLGDEFLDEVRRVIEIVGQEPYRFSIRFEQWRRANCKRFPHAVFYRIVADEPIIFAVLHARRDHPSILQARADL